MPVAEIARALNVAQVVEGSVRKSGNQVRITVSLTRASDGFSEPLGTFNEKLDDIFALQEKVARAVVEKLTQRKTTNADVAMLTTNPAAYDVYLQARARQIAGGRYPETLRLFEEAIRLDPNYALSWARYSAMLVQSRRNGLDRSEGNAGKAREAASAAMRFGPSLPEAHLAMAAVHLFVNFDPDAAERELNETQRLRPNEPEVPAAKAILESYRGHWDDNLVALIRQAVAVDPQNAANIAVLGGILRDMGRFAEADRLYARSSELSQSGNTPFHGRAGNYLAWTGDIGGALDILAAMPASIWVHELNFMARASMLTQRGEFAAAIDDYKKIRTISMPNMSGPRGTVIESLSNQGRLEARLGQLARAHEIYDEAKEKLGQYEKNFLMSPVPICARNSALSGEKERRR